MWSAKPKDLSTRALRLLFCHQYLKGFVPPYDLLTELGFKTGVHAVKKFTPSLGIPSLGV